MNRVTKPLFIGCLAVNVVLLSWMLLDYFYAESRFFSAILVTYAALVIVTTAVYGATVLLPAGAPLAVSTVTAASTPTAVAVAPQAPSPAPAPAAAAAPFVFNGYTLYSRQVKLKNGGVRPIYFFSKHSPKSGHAVAKPEGFHVGVNEETGLPFLKRGAGADGEDVTPEHESAPRPQCAALTEEGVQCRSSSRHGSKYCISHHGYQPPTITLVEAQRVDTLPKNSAAPDTLPTVRRRA